MGAKSSKGSCADGCFKGLPLGQKKATLVAPDCSPNGNTRRKFGEQVQTVEQALRLERPRVGSWSPKSPSTVAWATPAPRPSPGDPFELDLVIDDLAPSAFHSGIDCDGPFKRQYSDSVRQHRSKYEVEQLLSSPGSLPKPMLRDEREAVIRTLMPTATHEMLAKIPRGLLTKATEEAQKLRRNLVNGATVVFICAGLKGKRFILERAAALGVKSVVLDHPDSWSRELVKEGIIAKFLPVDMSQSSEIVFTQALEHIKSLGEDGETGSVDAITTFIELSVPLVARLCEALGLPGFRPEAVDDARDKYRTRACLAAAGLPTPKNSLIKNEEMIPAAAKNVGFPAVLKPVAGAASLGVKKVENEADLWRCYKEVMAEMSSLVVSSGALIKGSGSADSVDASSVIDLTLLLEQYLDGTEVDVDVVMSDGEWQYACVSDNGPTLEPYFNETWAVCPSLLPKDRQAALKDLAVGAVKALGFSAGIFHVECKYTSTGPQLIECNARMGGGQVRECNLLTWGVDLVEETLFVALGIPARPLLPKFPIKAVAYCYVNAKQSGTIGPMDCLKDLLKQNDVVWAKPLTQPGSHVVGPADGLPTWLCDLLVTKPTATEALNFLHRIENELPFEIV